MDTVNDIIPRPNTMGTNLRILVFLNSVSVVS